MDASYIVVGSDAQENWDIIRDSEPGHVWFHLNSFPSPHVIIRTDTPSKEDIGYAARLCKSKSKYRNIRNIKVVYTRIHNLELGDKVGIVNIISKRRCKYVVPE